MSYKVFIPYLLVMTVVTYLIRVLPLVLMNRKINNRFVQSFLYYVPYAVLSAMTFPAILFATNHLVSAACACITAIILAFYKRGLITVAVGSCLTVLLVELVFLWI